MAENSLSARVGQRVFLQGHFDTYDRQFAVSLSGIRTLPHQIEALNEGRGVRISQTVSISEECLCLSWG